MTRWRPGALRQEVPHKPRLRPERLREWPRVLVGMVVLQGCSWILSGTARLMGRRWPHRAERVAAGLIRFLLGVQVDYRGLEHIESPEPYVVVALHEGLIDPLIVLGLPLPLRFIVRDEIFEWPMIGRYLRAADHLRVDTDLNLSSRRRLLRDAASALGSGDSLVVFAQGSVLGLEVAFAEGAFRIALATGRPVLPVVITGTHRVWEHPYSPLVRFGCQVSVRVLAPVEPSNLAGSGRGLERAMKRTALAHDMAPVRRFVPERDGWWDGYPYEIDPDFPELAARVAEHRADGR